MSLSESFLILGLVFSLGFAFGGLYACRYIHGLWGDSDEHKNDTE